MTFLRGKSTSYTRFAFPVGATIKQIDAAVSAHEFVGIPDGELEAIGFCSYRNLLDASVDRGFLNASKLWLTGLRRDVKKAPPALVRASVARALADLRTEHLNSIPKAVEKEVAADVRRKLDLKAQARPAHAAVLVNAETGLGYIDGVSSAHDWVMGGFEATSAIYDSIDLNRQYLAWCAWRAGADVDTPCSPDGDISFREPQDSGATFDGQTSIPALLDYWIGKQRATINSLGLTFAVEFQEDFFNATVTLQAASLKVVGLEWPEQILDEPGDLDSKLFNRLSFLMAFEKSLADDFSEFAKLTIEEKLPENFVKLIAPEPPAE